MSALQWLAKRRLIKNRVYCENCNTQFGLNAYQDAEDGYRWKCKGCNKRKSVRDGSFFSQTAMKDAPNTLADDWANFCRDVCEVDLETNPSFIGGTNADGTPIVVEIDESKFFHRKYHRGQWRPGHWVFGGIERESRKCFLVELPDRTAATLQNCILQFILPGSHIVSDGWTSYAGIENLHNGIYSHAVFIHERNFVDPYDNDTHTQNIENLWMRAK
nr:uncharacterized protein LOC124809361 [Hydra vulgaris]